MWLTPQGKTTTTWGSVAISMARTLFLGFPPPTTRPLEQVRHRDYQGRTGRWGW